jgi:hypothetical protein
MKLNTLKATKNLNINKLQFPGLCPHRTASACVSPRHSNLKCVGFQLLTAG